MNGLPIGRDVAALVGDFAEDVENRSLLLEKFPLPKCWVAQEKLNDASTWSLLRVTEGGGAALNRIAESLDYRAGGRNTKPENREIFRHQAGLARQLARTRAETHDSQSLRAEHSQRMRALMMDALGEAMVSFCARAEGRLAINLSEGVIENAGIALDRLFGLPYIPGSALKGCARHVALWEIRESKLADRPALVDQFCRVFGYTENEFELNGAIRRAAGNEALESARPRAAEQKGGVTFLPAYPIEEGAKVVVDLTNVHYPHYYRTGDPREERKENPFPNPFPTVETGACFSFILALNGIGRTYEDSTDLLAAARQWLETALTESGVGAKTGAGYGWFSLAPDVDATISARAEAEAVAAREEATRRAEEARQAEVEQARLEAMSPAERAREAFLRLIPEEFAQAALDLPERDKHQQEGYVLALIDASKRDRWKKWKKSKKANDIKRVEAIRAAAKEHKIDLP